MFTSTPRQCRWPALIAVSLLAYAGPACLPPSLAESTDEEREFPTEYAAEDYGLGPHDEVQVTVLPWASDLVLNGVFAGPPRRRPGPVIGGHPA